MSARPVITPIDSDPEERRRLNRPDRIEMEFRYVEGRQPTNMKTRGTSLENKRFGETLHLTQKFLADC